MFGGCCSQSLIKYRFKKKSLIQFSQELFSYGKFWGKKSLACTHKCIPEGLLSTKYHLDTTIVDLILAKMKRRISLDVGNGKQASYIASRKGKFINMYYRPLKRDVTLDPTIPKEIVRHMLKDMYKDVLLLFFIEKKFKYVNLPNLGLVKKNLVSS